MQQITYKPIGIIHTPFLTLNNIPIQNIGATEEIATIEIFPEFAEGLKDLEGFSHIILLYHLHLVQNSALIVKPFMDTVPRGIFATRSPIRPNPIGFTIVKLVGINNNLLTIKHFDMLNNTPLLDMKPYISTIDEIKDSKSGWLTGKIQNFENTKSDSRFIL